MMRNLLLLFPAVSAAVLSGCSIINPVVPETGHYYINPQSDFPSIGRVVVLECDNSSDYPRLSLDFAQATSQELRKKHLFNVSVLEKSDPSWKRLDLDSASYGLDEMSQMRKELNCDAVIIGKITEYQPYPHMLVGVNMRMIDLRGGMVVWGMEQLWDSTDRQLERRMKVYYSRQMPDIYKPMDWSLLITSPTLFNKFVAYEIALTLPRSDQFLKMRLSSENTENFKKNSPITKKPVQIQPKPLSLPVSVRQ